MKTELKIVSNTDRPAPTVAELAEHKFSAKQLCAAVGISGAVLTNYLTKAKLKLSSESPGHGRPRAYYLIDVYQVALVAGLTRLTGRAADAAQAVAEFTLSQTEAMRKFHEKYITPGVADRLFEKLRTNSAGRERVRTAVLCMRVCQRAWNVARRDRPDLDPLANPFAKMGLSYKPARRDPSASTSLCVSSERPMRRVSHR